MKDLIVTEIKLEKFKNSIDFREFFNNVYKEAKENFEKYGYVIPVIHGICPDKILIITLQYDNQEEKLEVFDVIEKFLKKNYCFSYIMVAEAWVKEFDENDPEIKNLMKGEKTVSMYPDKKEMVIVTGEHKDGIYLTGKFEFDRNTKTITKEYNLDTAIFQNGLFENIWEQRKE